MSGAVTTAAGPQLTVRAILLSIVLTVMLAAANAYLGLFAGLTVATAIPAAVVSMGVLRLLGAQQHPREQHRRRPAPRPARRSPPGRDLHDAGARDPRPLDALRLLVGVRDRRPRRPARRAVLGAAAAHADHRPEPAVPGGRARPPRCCGRARPGARRAASARRRRAARRRRSSCLRVSGAAADAGVVRARGAFVGERAIAYVGINLSPALLGVGYIVGLNIGTRDGRRRPDRVVARSSRSTTRSSSTSDPELAARLAGVDAEDAARRDLDAPRCATSASARCWSAGCGRCGRCASRCCPAFSSGLAATRAGAAQWSRDTERDLPMSAILVGIVLFVLPLFVLYHAIVGSFGIAAADGGHHDRRRVSCSRSVSAATWPASSARRTTRSPASRSRRSCSPRSCCSCSSAAAARARSGRGDPDRRGHLLRGGGRRRQPAGPQGRPARRRDAVAAAGDARDRRRRRARRDGAGAEPAARRPTASARRRHPGVQPLHAPQATLMAAVAKGMFGGTPAVGHDRDRRRDRRRGHRARPDARRARRTLARAGARGRGRHLPAARATRVPIFLGGLLAELVERWHARHDDADATRAAAPPRRAVLVRADRRRGADRRR